ncbi:jg1535 [Pararge aegeria aegeria]|uniref:Jg1535 protein n=1 Tax=Pararge aegeria aegeria TaxID=348720 RepID=A0A8S4QNX0_9NEOP|nr:jg1535 [Pararge aegeria aegeria]
MWEYPTELNENLLMRSPSGIKGRMKSFASLLLLVMPCGSWKRATATILLSPSRVGWRAVVLPLTCEPGIVPKVGSSQGEILCADQFATSPSHSSRKRSPPDESRQPTWINVA